MSKDEFGNKGLYRDKSTNKVCLKQTDGTYDKGKCYFDIEKVMITDDFGNKGIYRDKGTNKVCGKQAGGTYNKQACYFDIETRAGAIGGPMQAQSKSSQKNIDTKTKRWGGCFDLTLHEQVKNKITGKTYEKSQLTSYKTESDCAVAGHTWKPDYLRAAPLLKSKKTLDDVLGDINNGRVSDINIFENIKPTLLGDVVMQSDNQETAIKGLVESTALSTYFLSKENTDVIQQTIRYRVHQKLGGPAIGYQSPESLYIIMRSILLQHGNFKVSSKDLTTEIQTLNSYVVQFAVNEISSNVQQYKGYLKDLSALPKPIDRPLYDDHGGRNKTYDLGIHIGVSI